MRQLAAQILVTNGYGYSHPITFNFVPHDDMIYIQMVENPDRFRFDQYAEVDPLADTLEGYRQLNILEKHYRIQTQQNSQGDVNTSALAYNIRSAGCDPRYGRLAVVEMCLRQDVSDNKSSG